MTLTPALIIDHDALQRNLALMRACISRFPSRISLRPHLKAHKSVDLARLQIRDDRTTGITAATTAEVAVASAAGVRDILLANELGTVDAVARLLAIAAAHPDTRYRVCVDSFAHVDILSRAHESLHPTLRNVSVLVEVNAGQNRCGCAPEQVVELARAIRNTGRFEFDGIQCYNGMLQHVRDREKRRELVMNTAVSVAKDCVGRLQSAGIECAIVTGGGTGTFEFEAESGVFTELQPGSYIFMDVDYGANHDTKFESSLYVMSTVISVDPTRTWAVIDAGTKAVSMDSGPPRVVGFGGLKFKSGGDEHGIIFLENGKLPEELVVGKMIRLVPGHCDPTVNLYDAYLVVKINKDQLVESQEDITILERWEIAGRYTHVKDLAAHNRSLL